MAISQNFPITRPSLNLNFARSQTLDSRITFIRTTTGTRVGPDGYIEVIPADQPRFDFDPVTGECLGLLIEENRFNSISNNTMIGAVVGTPGVSPTDWGKGTNDAELTSSIVEVGVESGISYIDVRVSGNVSESRDCDIRQSLLIPASDGQIWSHSVYLREVGGSQTNITDIRIQGNVYADTAYLTSPWFKAVSVTTESLITQRNVATATLDGETITHLAPYIKIRTAPAGVVDFTLRIGMPQLELGSFATSVIPTTDQGKTRTADNVSMTGTNFSDWYNQNEGTVYISSKVNAVSAAGRRVFELSDGTSENRLEVGYFYGGSYIFSKYLDVKQYETYPGISSFPYETKQITSYGGTDLVYLSTANNVLNTYDNFQKPDYNILGIGRAGTEPGVVSGNAAQFNGTISQLTYYPVRLSNQILQTLTK